MGYFHHFLLCTWPGVQVSRRYELGSHGLKLQAQVILPYLSQQHPPLGLSAERIWHSKYQLRCAVANPFILNSRWRIIDLLDMGYSVEEGRVFFLSCPSFLLAESQLPALPSFDYLISSTPFFYSSLEHGHCICKLAPLLAHPSEPSSAQH